MPPTIPIFTRPGAFTRPVVFTRPLVFSRPLRYGQYIDPDVAAFNAFGIGLGEIALPQYILNGLTEFVTSMKARAVWAVSDALYPIVGATTPWHSLNLKDPTTFRMVANGTLTNNSNGSQSNGVNGYWNPGYDVGLQQENGGFMSVYSRSNVAADGMYDLGFDGSNTALQVLDSIGNIAAFLNGGATFGSNSDSRGFFTAGIDGAANTLIFKNGAFIGGDSTSLPQPPSGDSIFFMANNNLDVAEGFSTRQYAFLGFGTDISFDAALYECVQVLQSSLGRQV